MAEHEVLVSEQLSIIDGLASSAVSHHEVAADSVLVRDDLVEHGRSVVQLLAGVLADSILAGAEFSEVTNSYGDCLAEEAD